jgi:hypothetical protein
MKAEKWVNVPIGLKDTRPFFWPGFPERFDSISLNHYPILRRVRGNMAIECPKGLENNGDMYRGNCG